MAIDPAEISKLYEQILYRAPDEAGLGFWQGQLDKGLTLDDLAQNLQQSQEYQQYVDPVQSAYSTFLPNQANDTAGINFWVNQYRQNNNEDIVAQNIATAAGITPESFAALAPDQYSAYTSTLDKFGLDPLSLWQQPGTSNGNFQWKQGISYEDTSWDKLSQSDKNRIIQTMYGEDSYSPDANIAQVVRNSLYTGNTPWQGHVRLGDTVENATRARRFNAWDPNDKSYQNNTSKFNPDHARWGEYAAVAEEVFNNKKPKHEYVYYATKGAKPGSPAYTQFQIDASKGQQDVNDQLFGERHDFWGKMPGAGIYGEVPTPPVNPWTQQDYQVGQGQSQQPDGFQPLQPVGYSSFPLSTDQYTFTGGSNGATYSGSGGDFQPIGPAGSSLPIFAQGGIDPSGGYNLGLGLPFDFSSGTGATTGYNTSANAGVDAIEPLGYQAPVGTGFSPSLSGTVNLGWGGDLGFSPGYVPSETYGAYNSAF